MSSHNAPICYGRQYSDQDQECQRCDWVQACKPEFLSANGLGTLPQAPAQAPAPIQPPWPYPPRQVAQLPTPIVPTAVARLPVIQPPPPSHIPRAPVAPVTYRQAVPMQASAQPAPLQAVQQPPTQAVVPQAYNPYFQQYYQPYAGEQTAGRVATHVALRMGFTLFSELAKFCEVWRPEPPSVI